MAYSFWETCNFPHSQDSEYVRYLRDINEVMYVKREYAGYSVSTEASTWGGIRLGGLLPARNFEPEDEAKEAVFINFLNRFGKKRQSQYSYIDLWEIRLRILLIGYQLFRKDFKQFRNILAIARNKKEFCILVGLN